MIQSGGNMKKTILSAVLLALSAFLVLTGCSSRPVFGVTENENNTITITAQKAPEGSAGISYLHVEEGEEVVVDAEFEGDGMIRIRMMEGVIGADDLPDGSASESTISGHDSMRFTIEPGEYTVVVECENRLTGTAVIRTSR